MHQCAATQTHLGFHRTQPFLQQLKVPLVREVRGAHREREVVRIAGLVALVLMKIPVDRVEQRVQEADKRQLAGSQVPDGLRTGDSSRARAISCPC